MSAQQDTPPLIFTQTYSTGSAAIDLGVVGDDVIEVTTRAEGEYGVVVRLPRDIFLALVREATTKEN